MDNQKLVYMANQIAKFFAHEGAERGAVDVADHLRQFWDPRMRGAILAHLGQGGGGLDPIAREAVEQLQAESGRR
jgi:formate dehydrogenase subunit delta